MATVTHYIYSHYDPEDRENIEKVVAQDEVSIEEEWQKEAPRLSNRLRAPPPQFVPATISYDDWSSATAGPSNIPNNTIESLGNSLSGWYRSLTTSRPSSVSTSSSNPPSHQSSLLAPDRPPTTNEKTKSIESRNKNNWFIMKAIQSETSTSASTPAPSLAEILARDPPPLPSEGKYIPPVWLEIGPSNKGFGMLQRSGWNEGEALGPDVVRRKPVQAMLPDDDVIPSTTDVKGKGKTRRKHPSTAISTRQETLEIKVEDMDDVSEIRQVNVIDLTLSDSDLNSNSDQDDYDDVDESDSGLVEGENFKQEGSPRGPQTQDHMPHNPAYARKALLTPIATVLKSDRLGIGLKAKTVGPHKASQKRVTHSAAALAAHVKAAEESRKRRKHFGRGKRGFEKQHRREEENRRAMVAYLKGT